MNNKVAVICANGCEEIETLSVVDVLRRLGIECELVGLKRTTVMGAHDIVLTCDRTLQADVSDYRLVVLPGGSLGAENLTNDAQLQAILKQRKQLGRYNAAICAAPKALAAAGLLDNANYTNFPGVEQEFADQVVGASRLNTPVVVDKGKHVITSRGPATTLAFAFEIAQVVFGLDTKKIKEAMQYTYLEQFITNQK